MQLVGVLAERGTGKTALAAHIHASSRREGPFIHKALPSLVDSLQQDALFGHTRGAFTGAVSDSRGLIEAAHTGTLFLDELAEATPALQATLLDVLERGTITRLGEAKERHVSVRLIAATNVNLEKRIATGMFRQDLLDRFGPFRVRLPSLRERTDEILPLFLATLETARREMRAGGWVGSEVVILDDGVAEFLVAAPWPGNVRQLIQESRFAARMASGVGVIRIKHFSRDLQIEGEAALGGCRRETAIRRTIRRIEIRAVLLQEGGDISATAARLHIGKRQVFRALAEPQYSGVEPQRGRPRKAG
jgi:NtrC-family two-component system response regulator AlgB